METTISNCYLELVVDSGTYFLVQRRQRPAISVLLCLALPGRSNHLGHLVIEAGAREVGIANGIHSRTVPVASIDSELALCLESRVCVKSNIIEEGNNQT